MKEKRVGCSIRTQAASFALGVFCTLLVMGFVAPYNTLLLPSQNISPTFRAQLADHPGELSKANAPTGHSEGVSKAKSPSSYLGNVSMANGPSWDPVSSILFKPPQPKLAPMTKECFEKSVELARVSLSKGMPRADRLPNRIYIAANQKDTDWVATLFSQFDATSKGDFNKYLCKSSVRWFFSEHTYEHISYQGADQSFQLMHWALVPGGGMRHAVPQYGKNHKPRKLDKEYGHQAFYTMEMLVAKIQAAGFQVRVREAAWKLPNGRLEVIAADTNDEFGLVARSFFHDKRYEHWRLALGLVRDSATGLYPVVKLSNVSIGWRSDGSWGLNHPVFTFNDREIDLRKSGADLKQFGHLPASLIVEGHKNL